MPTCNVYQTVRRVGVSKKAIQHIVFFTLSYIKQPGDVSVHCIGDTRMQTLNKRHRGKDRTTDVLSFAAQEGGWTVPEADWGDIFISIPQIRRQAKRHGVSYTEELYRMLIHGILHLLGYDHETKKDADIMFPLQETILEHVL